MKNARHVIAVTLMATAICADRALPSAPLETQQTHLAGRLMQRLCVNLRQTLPAARICHPQRFGLRAAELSSPRLHDFTIDLQKQPISPFQFRLPPPVA
jgi:hypothetical protein